MNPRYVVAFVVLLVASLPASAGAAGIGGNSAPVDAAVAEPSTAEFSTVAIGSDTGSSSAAVDATGARSTNAAGSADAVLHRTIVLRHLPDRPDVFETEMTFAVPDAVTELEIELEAAATVTATEGFEETADGTYRWTETTDEPSVTFTMPSDRRGDDEHAASTAAAEATGASKSGGDGYTFVDTGEWGVVPVPGVGISLRRTEPVALEETVTVDGPGATGGDIAFFGPVTEYERSAERETIRLAVPDAAELREDPEDVLEVLANASDRLDVGATSDEVFVVAVPTDVDWGPDGVQYGRSDAWVVADAELSEPGSVWLHEYVHARQGYANPTTGTTTETAWVVEAQAEYHAAVLALEQGLIDFEAFGRFLEKGERSPYDDGVLTDPHTWTDDRTDYVKGRLVAGELDRQLRVATDGDRTLADVVRVLNARDEPLTETAFLAAFEDAGGDEVRTAADRYTRTTATPDMWRRSDHEAAFDRPVAEFAYAIETDSIAVGDESWTVWRRSGAGSDGDGKSKRVLAVPAGERVTIPVTVVNVGDRDGTYDAALEVDGETVTYAADRLETGEKASETFEWTPSRPGAYDLRVGDDRLTAFVRSDSSVTVTDLELAPETVEPGEPITATATVEATDERPGAAVLAFRTPAGIHERPVAVAAGDAVAVEQELRFDDEGRYEVAVGDRSEMVAVGTIKPPAELEEVPGFGAAAAAIAVGAVLVAALVGRRRP